jgi:hypothetical protein
MLREGLAGSWWPFFPQYLIKAMFDGLCQEEVCNGRSFLKVELRILPSGLSIAVWA